MIVSIERRQLLQLYIAPWLHECNVTHSCRTSYVPHSSTSRKMNKIVWANKSNGQLCVTIPKNSGIKEGDIVTIEKKKIKKSANL